MIINASLPGSGGVKLASGSYVGTGTYGVDNKNTVNVGFAPKLFFVFHDSSSALSTYHGFWEEGCNTLKGFSDSGSLDRPCTVSGNTISWYVPPFGSGMHQRQLNISGETYRWFAIG